MKYKSSSAVLVLAVFFLAIIFISSSRADALPTTKYLTGYAWSSNIGWISFSGSSPRYSVAINRYDPTTSSDLSGYAWSSNIGWISFGCGAMDPDLAKVGLRLCSESFVGSPIVYPTGGGLASGPVLGVDNKLRGWARACSVFETGCSGPLKPQLIRGGWDGWISLSGMTAPTDGSAPQDYGVVFNPTATPKKFSSFAWGGGADSDASGNNISPQFPGWISFSGTNYGVNMVDTIVGAQMASCSRSPAVIQVGGTINWTASIIPAPPAGPHTYVWSGAGINSSTPGFGTDTITLTYGTPGDVPAPNVTIDGDPFLTSNCGGTIVIGPKDFTAVHSGTMSARFGISVNATTVPATVSVAVGKPSGQTVPYGYHVTLSFDRIEKDSDRVTKASGVANGADISKALIVSSVVMKADLDPDQSGGDSTTVVLNLTKNPDTTDLGTPPGSPVLPTGAYTVFLRVTPLGGSAGIKTISIPLRIDNPSGSVREI